MTLYGKIKNALKVRRSFRKEARAFLRLNRLYNASSASGKDRVKMQYLIRREAHTLEKGMSLRAPRKGFGQGKAEHLAERIGSYAARFGRDAFLEGPLGTLTRYVGYTESEGGSLPGLRSFLSSYGPVPEVPAVVEVAASDIREKARGDFDSLTASRHSIRYFTTDPVQDSLIEEALVIASRTPSACNRQGWKTHLFRGERCHSLLRWQGGCRGFEDEIGTCILVTADRRAFLYYETHQPYVDGGMYAMNLVNALHYEGLGTIPLSCGFEAAKLRGLRDFGIPENEAPVLLIGVGCMEERFRVAASGRRPVSETHTVEK